MADTEGQDQLHGGTKTPFLCTLPDCKPSFRSGFTREEDLAQHIRRVHRAQDEFRFHVVLNAPTAMAKRADEIPITYLNKGSTYTVSIYDTEPPQAPRANLVYRTSIHVSFDDEAQRQRPQACWQLWKEGRGTNEAHERGGRLHGVEFVALNSSVDRVELEETSYDGFSVKWYPRNGRHDIEPHSSQPRLGLRRDTISFEAKDDQQEEDTSAEEPSTCHIGVRFNFLSTDFSHSKGVKGVPVRLCAKTSLVGDGAPLNVNLANPPEQSAANASGLISTTGQLQQALSVVEFETAQHSQLCYCKVKLFRDHGAERKLSNDVAHVKKTIAKLQKIIAETDARLPQSKKRKYGEESQTATWVNSSLDSGNSWDLTGAGAHGSMRRELQSQEDEEKLSVLQAMLSSTRPFSVLSLGGEETDDPDLCPVTLTSVDENMSHQNDISNDWNPPLSRAGSQSSRASSPPRASSADWNRGHITPELIPFQNPSPPAGMSKSLLYSQLMRTSDEYAYSSIDHDQVRLLALVQGKKDDPIVCSLKILPIGRLKGSQLVYQALSYAWGDEPASEQILLGDVPQNSHTTDDEDLDTIVTKPFFVRPNLFAALKRLRVETEDLWFWIDAICINQDDDTEKSHQIPKMLDIYCNAWNVCIWLGELEHPKHLVGHSHPLDFVSTLVNLKLLDRITVNEWDEDIARSFAAFAQLLSKPWFGRRWVIQEVSASTRASVQCGDRKINWIDFTDAVQLFISKIEKIKTLYDATRLSRQEPDAITQVESAGARAIVQVTRNVLRKDESGKIIRRLWTLEDLVTTFVHFDVSNSRDTIYALFSLANDALAMEPDYKKPTLHIYAGFVEHCISSSGSLDIICRHWALPLSPLSRIGDGWVPYLSSIPSWIGVVTGLPFAGLLGPSGRQNGDSLVGDPGKRVYNASGGRVANCRFRCFYSLNNTARLFASGNRLATVVQTSPQVVDGIIPYDGFALIGWDRKVDVNQIPDRFWRILVADREDDRSKAPSWWRRACLYCLSKTNRYGDLNTTKVMADSSLPGNVRTYLKRVQAIVWNRRFFECKMSTAPYRTLYGLCPRDTQVSDLVCILYGCSVPVVLRKAYSGIEGAFELVGECYVHGMMDGEALELDKSLPEVEFRIR